MGAITATVPAVTRMAADRRGEVRAVSPTPRVEGGEGIAMVRPVAVLARGLDDVARPHIRPLPIITIREALVIVPLYRVIGTACRPTAVIPKLGGGPTDVEDGVSFKLPKPPISLSEMPLTSVLRPAGLPSLEWVMEKAATPLGLEQDAFAEGVVSIPSRETGKEISGVVRPPRMRPLGIPRRETGAARVGVVAVPIPRVTDGEAPATTLDGGEADVRGIRVTGPHVIKVSLIHNHRR